jgi:hypothetical protein
MALKKVGTDSSYFDVANNRFSSLTWHAVAENLNREYPDYAKRFTNINVKDRYDRVLKHHKVFARMANQMSGFVWNPSTFSFNQDEELIKKYQRNERIDEAISTDINIARFLCKPGHIDLEYYHRYIYQFSDQDELRNDSIINSPSFIEDAISKGILTNLSAGPIVFKEGESSNTSGSGNSQSGPPSNATSHASSVDSQYYSKNAQALKGVRKSSSADQNQGAVILPQNTGTQTLQNISNPQPQFQQPSSQQHLSHHPLQQTLQYPNQLSQQHLGNHEYHPHQHQNRSLIMPVMHQHQSNELDFSGLVDTQGSIINPQHLSQLPLIPPTASSETESSSHKLDTSTSSESSNAAARKRLKPTIPPGTIQSGLLVEQYEPMNPSESGSGSNRQHPRGFSTGEAVLQIHKEFEMMKSAVSEEIVQLRTQKMISFEDFQALQEIQENNPSFIRSAYKRIVGNQKILDLVNIYLNKESQ